jgi:hypothetical protein
MMAADARAIDEYINDKTIPQNLCDAFANLVYVLEIAIVNIDPPA